MLVREDFVPEIGPAVLARAKDVYERVVPDEQPGAHVNEDRSGRNQEGGLRQHGQPFACGRSHRIVPAATGASPLLALAAIDRSSSASTVGFGVATTKI